MPVRTLLTAVALAGALSGARGEEKEVRVKMQDLPEAVRKTVQEQARGATLRGLSREVENGQTFYEAELRVGSHGKDVLIDTSGAAVEVEEEVPLSSLPPAAREALQKRIAVTVYEAAVRKGLRTIEIKVTPAGRPLEP